MLLLYIYIYIYIYISWQLSCIFTSEPVPKSSMDNGHCGSTKGW